MDSTRPMNPWLSIWHRPRDTIQYLVDTNPTYFVLVLAAFGGFTQALDRAVTRSMGESMDPALIWAFCLVAGPFIGIVSLYICAAVMRWTGRWLGGHGDSQQIRIAVAWPNAILLWALPLTLVQLSLIGNEIFLVDSPTLSSNLGIAMSFIAMGIAEIVLAIWMLVVLLKGLGQVQGFSAWRALGNVLLTLLILFLPLFVLALSVYFVFA